MRLTKHTTAKPGATGPQTTRVGFGAGAIDSGAWVFGADAADLDDASRMGEGR
jgi:hypothetical protein